MSPDGVAPSGPGPHDPSMEARVGRLEEDMRDVKATLGRLEPLMIRIDAQLQATLPHLATKADLAEVRTELKSDIAGVRTELKSDIAGVRTELKSDIGGLQTAIADKPSRTYLWGILGVLLAAYACGLAGLAVLK